MKRQFIAVAALSLLAHSPAAAADRGADRLFALRFMAEACEIEFNPAAERWTRSMLNDMSDEQRAQMIEISKQIQAEDAEKEGHVGACYQLRVRLYHDGLL